METKDDLTLRISGMHCASCAATIEKGVNTLSDVEECQVNLAIGSARVSFRRNNPDTQAIIDQIEKLGFGATIGRPDPIEANKLALRESLRKLIISSVLSVPLMALSMWPMFFGKGLLPYSVDGIMQALLAGLIMASSGRNIIADAFRQSIRFQANMNSLIAIGTLTAFGWSVYALSLNTNRTIEPLYFETAGMIITLILLGRFLETRARGQAGQAIRALMDLRPEKTVAIINGVEVEIDPATAQPGMLLRVIPGERVPADGTVAEGTPTIDESMLTGESVPVEKRAGDSVTGGSVNGNNSFTMTVTASGDKSYLSHIIRIVTEAQSRKAPVQRLADKVAGIFVPIVLVIALITGLAWFFLAPDSPMLIRSVISVLIISCPCALGLATPTAVLAATGRAAKLGIIIKGGDILEKISSVDTVVFDKTGTLTHGKLEVINLETFGRVSTQSLLRTIGSLESHSDHPVAKAIVSYMKSQQIESVHVQDVSAHPGFGMEGIIDRRRILVGNSTFLESENNTFGPAMLSGEREMEQGRTVVYASIDGEVVGMLSLADRIRGDALEVVSYLKKSGRKVTMLSGDNRRTAEGVASLLRLDGFEAEIRPQQKKEIIETYRRAGGVVAMIGDGINDAPALAEADVAVAIGSGTDVAIETGDVVLSRNDLEGIEQMFSLSFQAMKTIRQNLFWAFCYNVIAIPLAAGLFYPVAGLTLSPMFAAAAMSFSSVFVVTNSLRLYRVSL